MDLLTASKTKRTTHGTVSCPVCRAHKSHQPASTEQARLIPTRTPEAADLRFASTLPARRVPLLDISALQGVASRSRRCVCIGVCTWNVISSSSSALVTFEVTGSLCHRARMNRCTSFHVECTCSPKCILCIKSVCKPRRLLHRPY